MKINLVVGVVACVLIGVFVGWHGVPYFGLGWLIGIGIFFAAQQCVQRIRRWRVKNKGSAKAANR